MTVDDYSCLYTVFLEPANSATLLGTQSAKVWQSLFSGGFIFHYIVSVESETMPLGAIIASTLAYVASQLCDLQHCLPKEHVHSHCSAAIKLILMEPGLCSENKCVSARVLLNFPAACLLPAVLTCPDGWKRHPRAALLGHSSSWMNLTIFSRLVSYVLKAQYTFAFLGALFAIYQEEFF